MSFFKRGSRSFARRAEGAATKFFISAVWSGAGRRWRRSISLPFAGWVPHERVSSREYLGLNAGVGDAGPRGIRGLP
jgi:hypothetical protein